MNTIIESYNPNEEYLYSKTYCFIKGYAIGRNYRNLLKALPLAKKMHNGQYRKGLVEVNGEMVKLPYVLHVLKVCSTLINLNLPLSNEEQDILYTCAILHDVLEDASEFFPNGGMELVNEYGLPKEVLEIVLLLSKRSGATKEETDIYFNKIKRNKYALLVKLADRSHNVEDIYNTKSISGYIEETKEYIYALCAYGKTNYPELSEGITTLKSKILSLTEATEAMQERFDTMLAEKNKEIKALEEEIQILKNAKSGQ